jgi:hypothetical protein
MERGSGKRSSSAGSEKMEKMVTDRKNGRTLFNRPKVTAGCSASGRRRRRRRIRSSYMFRHYVAIFRERF